jgi:hypothetical protein
MATSPTSTTTMHYGGSISSKTGRLGAKTGAAATFRKVKRLELMVRLENAGIPDPAAAAMLVISVPRLRHIKKSPEYLQVRMKITHGLVVDYEGSLANIKTQRREMLTQMLPAALQVLANEIQSPGVSLAERKHKVAVAQDIMDREGLFAKISKTEIKPVDEFTSDAMDAESARLIASVKKYAPAISSDDKSDSVRATIDSNIEFTNGRTINATEQQQALTDLEAEAALLDKIPADAPVN